ncbi:MAG TPA: hypothetical protein DHV15_03375 [Treponema sp.]|uniref:Uncharacterized protein n=1 Tax=Treponema denticola (strain ATCC 35405 / DSM 14222 / CIP 103919 / JCM 8153 / KCTC 15104) TaxID=243275 RepID=Q73Q27_TREDE|nr:hypothetical protein TDE_0617 [Treponema denticola ATCC 35405]HCY94540.1 hypothetical protein [Treponema sp.]
MMSPNLKGLASIILCIRCGLIKRCNIKKAQGHNTGILLTSCLWA